MPTPRPLLSSAHCHFPDFFSASPCPAPAPAPALQPQLLGDSEAATATRDAYSQAVAKQQNFNMTVTYTRDSYTVLMLQFRCANNSNLAADMPPVAVPATQAMESVGAYGGQKPPSQNYYYTTIRNSMARVRGWRGRGAGEGFELDLWFGLGCRGEWGAEPALAELLLHHHPQLNGQGEGVERAERYRVHAKGGLGSGVRGQQVPSHNYCFNACVPKQHQHLCHFPSQPQPRTMLVPTLLRLSHACLRSCPTFFHTCAAGNQQQHLRDFLSQPQQQALRAGGRPDGV